MVLSTSQIVLAAKRLEIAELKRLQSRAHLVGMMSHLIHALQAERGASSIFLASSGERFEQTRLRLVAETEAVEQLLRAILEDELDNSAFSNPKIISLIAWVLIGLDALPDLRNRIHQQLLSGQESVAGFSRLIAGLISLIFELADAAVDPDISRSLVSLFHLVDGKENAGQERAVGALAFGSGTCGQALRQQVLYLIDAQERNFRIFLEFAQAPETAKWQEMEDQPFMGQLRQLRQQIRDAREDTGLDTGLSDLWFQCCSDRISFMWSVQRQLVEGLQRQCQALITRAERALTDSEGLLATLRETPPARAGAVDRFFDPALPVERALSFGPAGPDPTEPARSVIDLLQAQTRHLAQIESELASAKQALNERKIIERAKGIAMTRYQLTEEEAYHKMRKISMDRNLRLVEVAELLMS